MLTPQQIEERKSYAGGSDCPGILGLSRRSTPLSVWAFKTGQIEPEDISDKICIKLGNILEQTCADFFMEETGKRVVRKNETMYHPEYPFLAANIDRRVIGERAGLECKTANQFLAKEWEDEQIPVEYIYQCYHYLAVTGWDRWYIGCIIGNTAYKWLTIERDEDLIKSIVEKEVYFWENFVVPKVMPMATSNDDDILSSLYPNAKPESQIALDQESEDMIKLIKEFEVTYKDIEKTIDEKKNLLRARLGDNETATGKEWAVTWKNQESSRVNSKHLKEMYPQIFERCLNITNSRVLRINKIKPTKEKK